MLNREKMLSEIKRQEAVETEFVLNLPPDKVIEELEKIFKPEDRAEHRKCVKVEQMRNEVR